MIQANELRLGNLLNSDKDTHSHTRKVSGIGHENHIVYLDSIHNRISSERIDIGHLKPIPLTEEWLLKFGFKNNGQNIYDLPSWVPYLRERKRKNQKWYQVFNVADCNIEYVHQLQNLYFALTGEELEVKL